MFQGTKDPLVPHTQAYAMVEAMTMAGVKGRADILVGASHGWGGKSAEFKHTVTVMMAFFDRASEGWRIGGGLPTLTDPAELLQFSPLPRRRAFRPGRRAGS